MLQRLFVVLLLAIFTTTALAEPPRRRPSENNSDTGTPKQHRRGSPPNNTSDNTTSNTNTNTNATNNDTTTTTNTGTGSSTSSGEFTLTSSMVSEGGSMPSTFTCDGGGSTLPLKWANPPANTTSFTLLMTTIPVDGNTKWNWILYNIPGTTRELVLNTKGVGTLGSADDGAGNAYAPPCAKGPGSKTYTFTIYALSGTPSLSSNASQNTGSVVTAAIKPLTLGSAALNVSYTRTTSTTSTGTNTGSTTGTTTTGSTTSTTTTSNNAAANCAFIQQSLAAYSSSASVDCSASDYAKISSKGMPTHETMKGILATNLQVPIAQNFSGNNAWKIPLNPAIAATTTSVNDGPIGIAINGVPIFNPCKQGGCQNGDTKVLGELDNCNGHAGRADDYHYHAAPTCLMTENGKTTSYWDTHPIGWALDGFAIFGYNNADGTKATRDNICGGNTLAVQNAPSGYSYHVTDASPYIMSCLRGTPSPDLAGQAAKYTPLRQPPVTPFAVSNMTLTTDSTDGYQVLQFTSGQSFTTTETGSDSYKNNAGSYRIRYKAVTGTALSTLLAQNANSGKSACWDFQFTNSTGTTTQPSVSYCR